MDKITELSKEILDLAIKDVCSEFFYLAYPIGLLEYKVDKIDAKAFTNGKISVLGEREIIKTTAEKGVNAVKISILHTLLHCIFLHPFKKVEDVKAYDLATDIVVSYLLDDLGYSHGKRMEKELRKSTYKAIIDLFGGINDKICIEYCSGLDHPWTGHN